MRSSDSAHSAPTSSQSSYSSTPETNAGQQTGVCLAAPPRCPRTPGTASSSPTPHTTVPAPGPSESTTLPIETHWIYRPKSSLRYQTEARILSGSQRRLVHHSPHTKGLQAPRAEPLPGAPDQSICRSATPYAKSALDSGLRTDQLITVACCGIAR